MYESYVKTHRGLSIALWQPSSCVDFTLEVDRKGCAMCMGMAKQRRADVRHVGFVDACACVWSMLSVCMGMPKKIKGVMADT